MSDKLEGDSLNYLDSEKGTNLRTEYTNLSNYCRALATFRVTLLGFYLAAVGLIATRKEGLSINLCFLGSFITICLYWFELRTRILTRHIVQRAIDIEQQEWKFKSEKNKYPFFSRQDPIYLKKQYALDLGDDYYYNNPVKILGRFKLRCKYITHSFALDLLYIGIFLFFIISMIFLFKSSPNVQTTGLQKGQTLNMSAGLGAKDISEIIKNYATCFAFLIGPVWAYMAFIRKREKYPCANVSHRVMHRRIDENRVFLKVIVHIENEGDVMVSLERKLVRVQQMIPWPSKALESIEVSPDATRNKECEVEWPLLAEVDRLGEKRGDEIEPGESDEFHVDFVIPAEVNTVVVYSYLKNVRKRKREIGWNTTSVYDIKNGEQS